MSSTSKNFVLIGPHAGKTMTINGHQFVDGKFTFRGDSSHIETLTRIFSFYGAVPDDQAGPEVEDQDDGQPTRAELDRILASLPMEQTDPDYVVNGLRGHFGELFTDEDEAHVRELVIAPPVAPAEPSAPPAEATGSDTNTAPPAAPPADVKPDLAEAIGLLDPEASNDWTSNNLPSLERLEALTGSKPSRSDVEGIAPGYTRAKAKAAKA